MDFLVCRSGKGIGTKCVLLDIEDKDAAISISRAEEEAKKFTGVTVGLFGTDGEPIDGWTITKSGKLRTGLPLDEIKYTFPEVGPETFDKTKKGAEERERHKTKEEVERIANKIEGAFRPLVCNAEIHDYKYRIKVSVLHEGKEVFEKELVKDDLTASPDALATFVNNVRRVVRKKIRETKPNFEFIDPDLEA